MSDQCPVCRGDVPLVDGLLVTHRHRDQFGPCPAGQVEPAAFTLAQAEEWARWAAVHDDWDQTRECMGVLLAEYDRLRAENADLRQKERALLDATLSALVAARMFGAGNESGWQAVVETAIDQASARLAALADVPGRDTEEQNETRCRHDDNCELMPPTYAMGCRCAARASEAPTPTAESQPVQVREGEDPAPRVWWDPIRGLLLCDRDVDHRLVDQPPAYNGCCALVPAEVDNPVRIADRLRGLKAVQVLKQLVHAIEDDHAGDMTPLWAEARRVLGETK